MYFLVFSNFCRKNYQRYDHITKVFIQSLLKFLWYQIQALELVINIKQPPQTKCILIMKNSTEKLNIQNIKYSLQFDIKQSPKLHRFWLFDTNTTLEKQKSRQRYPRSTTLWHSKSQSSKSRIVHRGTPQLLISGSLSLNATKVEDFKTNQSMYEDYEQTIDSDKVL